MEVGNNVSRSTQVSSLSASLSAAKTSATTVAADSSGNIAATKSEAEAYSLEITKTGASQTTDGSSHGEAVKGLSSEQISAMQDDIDKAYSLMIKTLTEQNSRMQGWLDEGIGKFNFDGITIGADRFGLPAVGTTPEEAAAAIADGGAYSVDSVADRLFGLASAIAGDDPERLKKMEDAISEGFKQAGLVWKDATGQDEMPEITKKTKDAITQRFTDRYAELLQQTAASEAIGQAGTSNLAAEAAATL